MQKCSQQIPLPTYYLALEKWVMLPKASQKMNEKFRVMCDS